ncbi:MAG: DUF2017 domain-containing protein [Propionibacteriaceae bacterium]|jgi:hypothetical protein|nr:DUF2017 domain-containing protein [Propionibacteriaceae bacterium]
MSPDSDQPVLRLFLEPIEVDLLRAMVAELRLMVAGPPAGDDPLENWAAELTAPELDYDDPAIRRLFPPAYAEAEREAEYRHLTEAGLRATKEAEAALVARALESAQDRLYVAIPIDRRPAWLRTVNSLRLSLATRLGVVDEAAADRIDDLDPDDPRDALVQSYHWLGHLLETILDTFADTP